jgi:hypothetical protein
MDESKRLQVGIFRYRIAPFSSWSRRNQVDHWFGSKGILRRICFFVEWTLVMLTSN